MFSYLKNLCPPRMWAVFFMGFSSALPLALTNSTLQAWFTHAGMSLAAVGALTFVGLPYVWKFLWAPLMDRFTIPWGGRRKGWILLTQLGLCVTLWILANMSPRETPTAMGLLACVIAFLSASQDIVIDAYRADVLLPTERGVGSAMYIFAARMALLIAGGVALIFADYFGWKLTYEIMAGLMALSSVATYYAPETLPVALPAKSFTASVIEPFRNLLKRDSIVLIFLFVIFYKIGDALAQALMSAFLLRGLGFSLTDIGVAYKTVSIIATMGGAFLGGILLNRITLFRALLWFGLAQAFSNLMFMLLAMVGKNYLVMVSAIFIENFCGGLSTVAFMAFLMGLCDARYSATQYACLAALSAIGRVFLGPVAAYMVQRLGWVNFYGWSFVICFPGIFFLSLLRNKVSDNAEVVQY